MRLFQERLVVSSDSFSIGSWSVEPSLDRIERGGESVDLKPQVMDVLVYLARNQGEVVSSEDITSAIWEGRVVTPSSIYVTINQLRIALGDDAKKPRYIETVPKRGYRLIATVSGLDESSPTPQKEQRWHPWVPWGAALAVALALAVVFTQFPASPEISPDHQVVATSPSIAVLPFADLSPAQDQQWFADGVSEEIINRLTRVDGLKVTGRTSSFLFRDKQSDIQGIGQALGVNHVVEGSIRSDGEQVRVTAQLLRTEDGFHLWSENFKGNHSEIFTIQDEIAARISASIRPQLAGAARAGAVESIQPLYPRLDAYELYLRALEQLNLNTRQSLLAAQDLLERALDLDPDYADAHVAMANVFGKFVMVGLTHNHPYETYMAAARPHVERALEIDPSHAGAWAALARVLMGQEDRQKEALEKALSLNPNLHQVYVDLGTAKLDELVSWREVLAPIERAAEIEPMDVETALMLVLFMQRVPHRWDEAEAVLERLSRAHPDRSDVMEGQGLWWMMVRGQPARAVPLFERALRLDPDRVWVKIFLARCWYMVGEFKKAAELQSQSMQWTAVFNPDREQALQDVKAPRDWDENDNSGLRMLTAYTLLMLRDFQAAVDVLGTESGDFDEFTRTYGQPVGMHFDPGMTLATAHWSLGHQEEHEKWAGFTREAIKTRSENGRLHTFEYSAATARLDAMEGREYSAMLELEWFVTHGPLDIRELMYPAYDGMRTNSAFKALQQRQLERVNAERAQLGLEPYGDFATLTNRVQGAGR